MVSACGRGAPALNEAMPFTSVNAHNLWWLLGPWRDANAGETLTPKFIGLTLFLVVYAVLLARAASRLAAWFAPCDADLTMTWRLSPPLD